MKYLEAFCYGFGFFGPWTQKGSYETIQDFIPVIQIYNPTSNTTTPFCIYRPVLSGRKKIPLYIIGDDEHGETVYREFFTGKIVEKITDISAYGSAELYVPYSSFDKYDSYFTIGKTSTEKVIEQVSFSSFISITPEKMKTMIQQYSDLDRERIVRQIHRLFEDSQQWRKRFDIVINNELKRADPNQAASKWLLDNMGKYKDSNDR